MRLRLVPLLLLTAVACGGGAGKTRSYSTAQRLADVLASAVGCNDFALDSSGELFTREQGSCTTRQGEELTIRTFATDEAEANWSKAAAQFGGIDVSGPRWVVTPEKQTTAEQIAAVLGGTVR